MKKIKLFLFTLTLIVTLQNCGEFNLSQDETEELSSLGEEVSVASTSNAYQLVQVADQATRALDSRYTTDFNKDGVKDLLSCWDNKVVVKDGKNINRTLLTWSLPNPTIRHYSYSGNTELKISNCDVAYIKGNNPSIVIGSSYINPAVGMRIQSYQYILYNNGTTRPGGILSTVPQTFKISQEGRVFPYKSAARSVKCTKVPQALVNRGHAAGAMCFYSGYDGPITRGGAGTATALIKFEPDRTNNNKLQAVDLTIDSGLPWSGGPLGTPMNDIPTYNLNGNRKHDGLHMMDSAFLDYNSDGLPDIITVGQHASIRLHTMRLNNNTNEGLSFNTSIIHRAQTGAMTEFLRVQAFNEQDASIGHKCVIISGEDPNVYDHVRCYHGGQWQVYNLPFNMSRGVRVAGIARVAPGVPNMRIRAYDEIRRRYLSVVFRKTPGQVIGNIDQVAKVAGGMRVRGWACQEGVKSSLPVHVYVGASAFQRGGTMVHAFRTHRWGESAVNARCKERALFRFDLTIPKTKLRGHAGKPIYLHGIKQLAAGPGRHNAIGKSGQFRVPSF